MTSEAKAASMVEQVARALWDIRERRLPERVRRRPDDMDRATGAWALVMEDALAVMETLKEPTGRMKVAGGLLCEAMLFEGKGCGVIFEDMGDVFAAMIEVEIRADAALSEEGR